MRKYKNILLLLDLIVIIAGIVFIFVIPSRVRMVATYGRDLLEGENIVFILSNFVLQYWLFLVSIIGVLIALTALSFLKE